MPAKRHLQNCALVLALVAIPFSPAAASKSLSGDVCTFESDAAIYGGGPPEPVQVTWNLKSGEIKSFGWDHGGVPWYSYSAAPGTVQSEAGSSYYYVTNIGVTTAGYDTTRYSLKGYIAIDGDWPSATFVAVYEGTGTSWMAAKGKVTCK